MMAHKGIKFNSCHICGKQFSTAFRVRRHLSCHGIPEYVTETVLVNATEPEVHLQTSDEIVYDPSVGLEEENEEDNIHARGRDYQCYICNQKCDNLRRFKLHFKKQHETVEFNSCHICFKPFPTTFKVRRHIVSHYVEAKKSLESNINSYSDSSKSIIKKNANILMNFGFVKIDARHRGIPKTYSCYICNENCQNYSLYKGHFYSKHKGIKLNACHICNKQFTSTTKVKRHLQTHTNDRKYGCHDCGKRFTQFAHLKRHRALMHTVRSQRLNKCMYCPKLYADKVSFDKHVMMHQLAEQSNFKCSVCQEKFIEERLLDEHILAFHDFFKKFQCTVCKRRFQKESFLNRHMMIHTGLRKWKCFKCNKRFGTKSDLSRHALTHTDLKPFPCFFCDKLFTRSSNRQKHISLFHDTRNIHVNNDKDIKPSPD
ncbi:hypothetical protein JTE90_012566 [Oedothorax gibbosus]|nr:hypothetical protein JTE90_012566 [Oedothorax gibbosus]